MSTSEKYDSIPDTVLDRAFEWAVRLSSGEADEADREAFEAWLARDPVHAQAWARVQAVEQEFRETAGPVGAAGRHALERLNRRRRRRRLLATGSAGTLLMLMAGIVLDGTGRLPGSHDYSTDVGEKQVVELEDETRIHLKGETRLDIESRPEHHRLQLRAGTILVQTGANARVPLVSTAHSQFRPLGTRFVVEYAQDKTELAVLEGVVALEPRAGGQRREARAGERWRTTADDSQRLSRARFRPGAWAEGLLDVRNARLDEVLERLERHRIGWLTHADDIGSLRVTGVFHLDDTETALRALERSLPVRIERTTDYWIRLEPDRG